jgi:hypothetical protein
VKARVLAEIETKYADVKSAVEDSAIDLFHRMVRPA